MSQYSLTALRHYYLYYSNLKYYKDFILLFVHPAQNFPLAATKFQPIGAKQKKRQPIGCLSRAEFPE